MAGGGFVVLAPGVEAGVEHFRLQVGGVGHPAQGAAGGAAEPALADQLESTGAFLGLGEFQAGIGGGEDVKGAPTGECSVDQNAADLRRFLAFGPVQDAGVGDKTEAIAKREEGLDVVGRQLGAPEQGGFEIVAGPGVHDDAEGGAAQKRVLQAAGPQGGFAGAVTGPFEGRLAEESGAAADVGAIHGAKRRQWGGFFGFTWLGLDRQDGGAAALGQPGRKGEMQRHAGTDGGEEPD